MLQLVNLSKDYSGRVLFANISWHLRKGERVGLIGPNGCGKTTLLRIVTGQEPPDRGAVRVDPPGLRLGYLEQGLRAAPGETVGDLLRYQDRSATASRHPVK